MEMADNARKRAPLWQRTVAAGVMVLIALAFSGAASVLCGAAAGFVWRWVRFGFELVQP